MGRDLLLCALLLLSTPARAQKFVPLFPDQPVPPGFETQTLFLICNPDWLQPQREADLAELFAYYVTFGRVIGERNAALWFWREEPDLGDGIVDDIDIERNAALCAEAGLRPSQGPHLVFNTKWDRDHFVLSFAGLDATGIKRVLAGLADGLVTGDLDADRLRDEVAWQRMASVVRSVFSRLGDVACGVKAVFDAKFLQVEVDGAEVVGDACG